MNRPLAAVPSGLAFVVLLTLWGCTTAAPPQPADSFSGVASWYGEEYAGRTTANGEIFDPARLTAAHRTLPFGTLLDVSNPKTGQQVRVRVNDRGPYIGNRVIDLSYAAAREIGLIEPGVGEVQIRVVRLGGGDREAPAPFDVAIAPAPPARTPSAGDPPEIAFPLPGGRSADATVDAVDVQVERGGMITRRQVTADGTGIEEVPIGPAPALEQSPRPARSADPPRAAAVRSAGRFHVQVGAFSVEANAIALRERLVTIGQQAWIDRSDLFRVRIGPFVTREEAAAARTRLEATGISAIIVTD